MIKLTVAGAVAIAVAHGRPEMRPPVAVAVASAVAHGRLGDSYGDVRFLQLDIDNGGGEEEGGEEEESGGAVEQQRTGGATPDFNEGRITLQARMALC